jgi:hypothetical protein
MNFHHTLLVFCAALLLLIVPRADAQQPDPKAALLALADHAAAADEAARRCDDKLPGSGAAIRSAHGAWQIKHGAAQQSMLDTFRSESLARAQARGTPQGESETVAAAMLTMLRFAAMDKLRQSMAAMDGAQLKDFCASYPNQFDTPDMDLTSLHLRERSRKRP